MCLCNSVTIQQCITGPKQAVIWGGGAMHILTGFFLSSLSVTDEHRGLLNPVVNYVGTGESYSHKEKQWGGKEDADECRSCMFLEIWPPQGYALTALN